MLIKFKSIKLEYCTCLEVTIRKWKYAFNYFTYQFLHTGMKWDRNNSFFVISKTRYIFECNYESSLDMGFNDLLYYVSGEYVEYDLS